MKKSLIHLACLTLTGLLLAGCASSPKLIPTVTSSESGTEDAIDAGIPNGSTQFGTQSLAPYLCSDIQDHYVVAHEDDDLLFMNPDLASSIRLKHCVLTTFLTAGNDNKQGPAGLTYMKQREEGIRKAYAAMSGVPNIWSEGTFYVNRKKVKLFALSGNQRVMLTFFRLSDGAESDYFKTLAALNSSSDPLFKIVAIDRSNSFTKRELVKTLADMMKVAEPKYLHIQDSSPDPYIKDNDVTIGDHVDHIVSARLVEAAEGQYIMPHMVVRYRDYNINAETTPNLSLADQANKLSIFNIYAANDPVVCSLGNACIQPGGGLSVYSFYGWTQRQYFNIDDNQQGSVLSGRDGRLQTFVIGDRSSSLRNITQTVSSGSWSAWQDLKGNFSARPVVVPYADGRLAAFVHSNYGTMFVSTQTNDLSWNGWRELAGQGVSNAAASLDSIGNLRAVSMSNQGQLFEMSDSTSRGDWNSWSGIYTPFYASSDPAIALSASKQLVLFALDKSGALRRNTQNAGSSTWPTSWPTLGGSFASAPVMASNADGRLEVFVQGTDHRLYHSWQSAAGDWAPLEVLGDLTFSGQPAVTLARGLLSVAVRNDAGSVSLIQQNTGLPGTAWSGWQSLGAPTTFYGNALSALIGAGTNADGNLKVIARAVDGNIYDLNQTAGGFSAWDNLYN